jgi:hypothetical protein
MHQNAAKLYPLFFAIYAGIKARPALAPIATIKINIPNAGKP